VTITDVSGALSHQTTIQLTVTRRLRTCRYADTDLPHLGDLVTGLKPCGATLAPGKLCKIRVTFTPTQVGSPTGNGTITDNAPDSPQLVPLSGTGK